MKIYHVVATANNRVIGKNGQLPWHFSSDLKYFKELTTGSTVIMGRKTFESINEATKGKLLPEREMVVLTRGGIVNAGVEALCRKHVVCIGSWEEAKKVGSISSKAFVIGGADLYAQTIHDMDGIYLTRIHADYEGDAFYPEIPAFFKEKSRRLLQENPKLEVIYYER